MKMNINKQKEMISIRNVDVFFDNSDILKKTIIRINAYFDKKMKEDSNLGKALRDANKVISYVTLLNSSKLPNDIILINSFGIVKNKLTLLCHEEIKTESYRNQSNNSSPSLSQKNHAIKQGNTEMKSKRNSIREERSQIRDNSQKIEINEGENDFQPSISSEPGESPRTDGEEISGNYNGIIRNNQSESMNKEENEIQSGKKGGKVGDMKGVGKGNLKGSAWEKSLKFIPIPAKMTRSNLMAHEDRKILPADEMRIAYANYCSFHNINGDARGFVMRNFVDKIKCVTPTNGGINNTIFEKNIAAYYAQSTERVDEYYKFLSEHIGYDPGMNEELFVSIMSLRHLTWPENKQHYRRAPVEVRDTHKGYQLPKARIFKGHVRYVFLLDPGNDSKKLGKLTELDEDNYAKKIEESNERSYVIIFEPMYDISLNSLSGESFNSSKGKIASMFPYMKYCSYMGRFSAIRKLDQTTNYLHFIKVSLHHMRYGDEIMKATINLMPFLGCNFDSQSKDNQISPLIHLVRVALLIAKFVQEVRITHILNNME